MSKHARPTLALDRAQQAPKHSKGWSVHRGYLDAAGIAQTPGKHAKPFGKHRAMAHEVTAPTVTRPKKQRTQAPTECLICNDLATAA